VIGSDYEALVRALALALAASSDDDGEQLNKASELADHFAACLTEAEVDRAKEQALSLYGDEL
jgi:hypothetical protein